MAELYNLTIAEARARLDAGEITSAELTEALLDRIAAVDNQVRAYLAISDGRCPPRAGRKRWPARRHPARNQGRDHHRGADDHLRLENS